MATQPKVDKRFDAILPIYERLAEKSGGIVDTDVFIAEIDREVEAGRIESPWTATLTEAFEMYKRRIVAQFFEWLEGPHKRRYLGVPGEKKARAKVDPLIEEPGFYAPVDSAWGNRRVATQAGVQYRSGLTMVERYGPYHDAFERSGDEVASDLDHAKVTILAAESPSMRAPTVAGTPDDTSVKREPRLQDIPPAKVGDWMRDKLCELYAEALPHRARLKGFEPFFVFVETIADRDDTAKPA